MNISEKIKIIGTVKVTLKDKIGRVKDESVSHNLITNLGLEYIADLLSTTPSGNAMNYMAIGVGSGQTVTSQTLASELYRKTITSKGKITGANFQYFTSFAAGQGTGSVQEVGIFNASSGGTMLCYNTYPVKTKGASDILEILWTISFIYNT